MQNAYLRLYSETEWSFGWLETLIGENDSSGCTESRMDTGRPRTAREDRQR